MLRRLVPLIAAAILSGCATQRPPAPPAEPSVAAVRPPKPLPRALPSDVSRPQDAPPPPAPVVVRTVSTGGDRGLTLSKRTALELSGDCTVESVTRDVLVVKQNGARSVDASLYEQAIYLARVRSRLAGSLPRESIERVTLRDGVAHIPFTPDIAPSVAAEAISEALAVDGIDRVKATFR